MKDLEGKVALVTGSFTGLGLAIAMELGSRGATVALNYAHRTDHAEKAQMPLWTPWILTCKPFPWNVGGNQKTLLKRLPIFVRRAPPSSLDKHCV